MARARSRTTRVRTQTDVASAAATWVIALVAPMLLGGATPTMSAVICVGALSAALLSSLGKSIPVGRAALFTGAAVVWTTIQLTPLPPWLVEWASPQRFEELQSTHELLSSSQVWMPISLDPGGTRLALLHAITIACGVLLGAILVQQRRSLPIRIAAVSCGAMAIVSAMHEVVGVDTVFGLYDPVEAGPRPMSPLMNPNHLAAFLAFGVPIQLLIAWRSRGGERFGWCCLALLGALLVPLTASRAGTASLVVGVVLLVLFLWPKLSVRARMLTMGSGVVTFALGLFASPVLLSKLQSGDTSKLNIAVDAIVLGVQFPILGVGRGAFAPAFAQFTSPDVRPTYVENLPVHWMVEWGLPFSFVGLSVVGFVLLKGLRKTDITVRVSAATLLVLGAHDLADYSLELPGVAFVASLVFGAVVAKVDHERSQVRPTWGVAAMVALAFLAYVAGAEAPTDATRRLLTGPDSLSFEVTPAVTSHPLEPGVAMAVARLFIEQESEDAIRWVNRSMQLAPSWPGPHELAATWLFRHGAKDQALLEVREANRTGYGHANVQACDWVNSDRLNASRLATAIPSEPEQASRVLDRFFLCLRNPEDLAALDAIAEERGIESLQAMLRVAHSRPPEERIAYLRSLEPVEAVRIAHAETLLEMDRPSEALAVLPGAEEATWTGLCLRATAAAEANDESALGSSFAALDGRFGQSLDGFVRVARAKMIALESAGRQAESLDILLDAAEAQPDTRIYRLIDAAATRYGVPQRASRARRALCLRGNVAFCRETERP